MSEYIVDGNLFIRLGAITINHEEVVRCRDCKHYHDRNGAILPSTVCQRLGYYNFKAEPDGFCAWSCRKDKE